MRTTLKLACHVDRIACACHPTRFATHLVVASMRSEFFSVILASTRRTPAVPKPQYRSSIQEPAAFSVTPPRTLPNQYLRYAQIRAKRASALRGAGTEGQHKAALTTAAPEDHHTQLCSLVHRWFGVCRSRTLDLPSHKQKLLHLAADMWPRHLHAETCSLEERDTALRTAMHCQPHSKNPC